MAILMNTPRTHAPETAPETAPRTTIAVIGAGRLGRVLAPALRRAGFTVTGPHRRDESIPATEIALLCVPDAAIAEAARNTRGRARLIGHLSGATGLTDVDFSIHPLQTFTGAESPDVFHDIGCGVAGRTDGARAMAAQVARALGAQPFDVGDSDRAAYHAAASLASNLVLTVLDAAEQVAGAAGIRPGDARVLLAPLVRRTVDNWAGAGARDALTGPIARGDEITVDRQRTAIADATPELTALFDELCARTREIARTGRVAAPTEAAA